MGGAEAIDSLSDVEAPRRLRTAAETKSPELLGVGTNPVRADRENLGQLVRIYERVPRRRRPTASLLDFRHRDGTGDEPTKPASVRQRGTALNTVRP